MLFIKQLATEESIEAIMIDPEDSDSEQAIRRALVRLLPRLRHFCLALSGAAADADDLCQSTLERAITRLDLWVPGTRLDSWLYRIAQNLHKNAVRDRVNRIRILDEHAADACEEQALPAGDAGDIWRHVLALPQAQREVVIMVCVEGYSYKECADLLDLPETTITNRLFKARTSLRLAMQADATDDDVATRRASA